MRISESQGLYDSIAGYRPKYDAPVFWPKQVIPYTYNRPSPCLHKKCSELLLSHHTFYNELCKYLPDKNHFRFIFLLNSFSVWICQRLLRVMERKVREQKKSTKKILGMQNFSPF